MKRPGGLTNGFISPKRRRNRTGLRRLYPYENAATNRLVKTSNERGKAQLRQTCEDMPSAMRRDAGEVLDQYRDFIEE